MPRVVPSIAVRAILEVFPWVGPVERGQQGYGSPLGPDQAPNLAAVLGLIDGLPPDLLPRAPDDFVVFELAKGALRGALLSWSGAPHPGLAAQLGTQAVFGGDNAIVAIVKALRRCPDDAESEDTASIAFVTDPRLRADLRLDISTAFRTLGNGEYKAATVLAGSVSESLLLDRIQSIGTAQLRMVQSTIESQRSHKLDSRGAEYWGLADYIDVAKALRLIKPDTHTAAHLMRDFRNLIHPGRILRTGGHCTQATALIALGAMHQIIDDLASAA